MSQCPLTSLKWGQNKGHCESASYQSCSLPSLAGCMAVWDKNYISQPPIRLVLSSGNENWSCGFPPATAGLPEPCILPYFSLRFSAQPWIARSRVKPGAWS